jgi:mannose/cellobiose epimerase-like protein (N-acyl-D-glucosamine 2-epimerase family)
MAPLSSIGRAMRTHTTKETKIDRQQGLFLNAHDVKRKHTAQTVYQNAFVLLCAAKNAATKALYRIRLALLSGLEICVRRQPRE